MNKIFIHAIVMSFFKRFFVVKLILSSCFSLVTMNNHMLKMLRPKGIIYRCIICIVSLWVSGCASLATYQSQVDEYTATFLSDLDQKLIDGKLQMSLEGKDTLSFKEACLYAALVDSEIVELLAGLEQAKIHVESAASNIWPRLQLQLKSEMSAGDSNSDSVVSTGGVYIRYDFIKALTSGDEKAIRKAYVLKDIVNIKLAINRLAKKLYKQLAKVSSARLKLEKRKEALEIAQNAMRLAHVYGDQKRVSSETVWQWEGITDQHKASVLLAEQELLIAQRSFNALLGVPGAARITMTDQEEVLTNDFVIDLAMPSASTIWFRHGQARLAEIKYMAAEANLKQAKIAGWPKLTADFGLGSIPITNEVETSNSVVTLSLQVPLIDMGDQRRKVEEATITLDLVKTGLQKTAEMLWLSADNSFARFEQSQKQYQQITAQYDRAAKSQAEKKELYDEGHIDTLDVVPQKIRLMELEVRVRETLYMVQEAAIDYNLAIGNDFRPEFSSSLLDELLAKRLFARPE